MENRIKHYFASWEGLLAAKSAAPPENPVTLVVAKGEMVNLLAGNIMQIILNQPPFFTSAEEQEEYRRLEAERRAFLEWVRQCPSQQLVVAALPCSYGAPDALDGGEG